MSEWDPVHNPNHPLILLDREARTFKALVAPLDACILNGREGPGRCVRPPRDGDGYSAAMRGSKEVVIPWKLSHASESASFSAAADHYADSSYAALLARYYEDGEAIWAEGRVAPGLTDDDMDIIAASALSGDWRWKEEQGRLRMIASQVVSVPGFAPSYALRASASADGKVLTTWYQPDLEPVVISASIPDMACTCGAHTADPVTASAVDIEAIAAAVWAKVQENITAATPPMSPGTSTAPVVVPPDPAQIDDGSDTGSSDLEQRVSDLESTVAELIAQTAGEPMEMPEAQLV